MTLKEIKSKVREVYPNAKMMIWKFDVKPYSVFRNVGLLHFEPGLTPTEAWQNAYSELKKEGKL